MKRQLSFLVLMVTALVSSTAFGWHDATHMAVMKAAGLDDYAYLAVGPDMAKEKSGGHEDGNHYCNNKKGSVVTADMVLDQVRDYNCRCGGEGHLYGAIVAALDQYLERTRTNKYSLYHLGYAAHYIADLSMPLHNIDYDDFNKANHADNDGVVEKNGYEPTEKKVARIAAKIKQKMKSITPYRFPPAKENLDKFNLELAKKIAEIANSSIALGYAMHDGDPPRGLMTADEAYGQLAQSAFLLKAACAALR